jgi:GNAT superfamily N-acetyltransferase
MAVEIVRGGIELVPELRELWLALRDHHAAITADDPTMPPVHDDEASWAQRRADYEQWLSEPDAFVLVARDGGPAGRPVGYAMVTVNEGSPTWRFGRAGDVESLSLLPAARGRGIGAALLDAVEEQLAAIGVDELRLTVVAANEDARRFYAREGFTERFLTLTRDRRRRP